MQIVQTPDPTFRDRARLRLLAGLVAAGAVIALALLQAAPTGMDAERPAPGVQRPSLDWHGNSAGPLRPQP